MQAIIPASPRPIVVSPEGLSIFSAVREQVGLTLASPRGPVDVWVIDHVNKPTAD